MQLKRDLSAYYGYNEFMLDVLLNMFTVAEALEVREVWLYSSRFIASRAVGQSVLV